MSKRLSIETIGGNASESDTFMQLLEQIRLAQESCYVLGHLRKANDDNLTGQGFLAIGEMFAKVYVQVTTLATGRIKH